MKRTLTLSLFLGLVASAMAQTPTVVEKPLPKSASAKSATPGAAPNTKAAVANVKVIAVPASAPKPSAVVVKTGTAKPTVIAMQPAAKSGAVAPQKIAVAPQQKVAVVPQKIAVAPQQRVAAMPAPKVAVAPAKGSIVASKPVPATISVKGAPAPPQHPVMAASPAIPAGKVPAVKAAVVPVVKAGNAKDPFNKNKQTEKSKTAVVAPSGAPAKVAVRKHSGCE